MNSLLKKAGLGVVLAATALTAAAPADAQRWGRGHWHRDRGIGSGGAAVLGGIVGLGVGAAIASSNNNRGGFYDRGYAYDGYYNGPPPRAYYRDDYRPRCWSEWRRDPYYGDRVRVQVCD